MVVRKVAVAVDGVDLVQVEQMQEHLVLAETQDHLEMQEAQTLVVAVEAVVVVDQDTTQFMIGAILLHQEAKAQAVAVKL
jgi:predicted nucleic acid-binding protein